MSDLQSALQVNTPGELSRYLEALSQGMEDGTVRSEHLKAADLVDAAGAWVEGIDVFLEARQIKLTDLNPWQIAAIVFAAANVYE
jgi:hypothetical protein